MQQHECMAVWIFAMNFRFVFLKSEFEKFLICFLGGNDDNGIENKDAKDICFGFARCC